VKIYPNSPPKKAPLGKNRVGPRPDWIQFRDILDHIDDQILFLEQDGTLSYLNKAAGDLLGVTAESTVGRPFIEMVHPKDAREVRKILDGIFTERLVSKDKSGYEIRFRLKGRDHHWISCMVQSHIIETSKTGSLACLLIIQEGKRIHREPLQEAVQELVQAVESKNRQLAESEAEYSSLIDTMNDGFWVLDRQGKILFVNEKLTQLLGYENSDLIGRDSHELFQDSNREIYEKQIRRRSQGKVGSYEVQLTCKDGSEITCLVRGAPRYNVKGDYIGNIANITDISASKKLEDRLRASEREYRDLFENMLDVVCRMDKDGKILAMNRVGMQTLGFEKTEDLLRRDLKGFFVHRSEWQRFKKDLSEKGFIEDEIFHFQTQDGRTIAMSVNAHISMDAKGWPVGFDGVFRDVSERVRMEGQLQRYAADLEKKNEELESLIYSITHDFKSPLLVVGGLVSRLDKVASGVMGKKGRQYLDWIRSNVAKMEKMVNDLLLFYRADKTLIPFESVSTGALIDTVFLDAEPLAREKGVQLIRRGPFPIVNGYRNRLYQVFYNLVENAIKYSESTGDTRVEVECQFGDEEHQFIIKDNGPGISSEHHKKIFQIFYTLEPESASGSGIGLSIVKKVIKKHGGRIWVESEPGKGTTFLFTLPSTLPPSG